VKVFEWHSELAERLRLKLGWSHYAIYWVSFIKGVGCAVGIVRGNSPNDDASADKGCTEYELFHWGSPLGVRMFHRL